MQNILGLVPNLSRKSVNEWAGPCIWCGGKDRFIAWPDQGNGGRFLCRQCQRKGDCIDILRDQGMSFAEAQRWVDGSPNYRPPMIVENKQKSSFSKNLIDENLWTKSATDFVTKSMSSINPAWHEILKKKSLTTETALKFNVGWNACDQFLKATEWGLSDGTLLIPAGLVIPICLCDQIIGIKIRCSNQVKYPRYLCIKGSQIPPTILGLSGLPVVFVESELDAFLIWQEAATHVSVIALGGLNCALTTNTIEFAKKSPRILIATDYDDLTDDGQLGPGQKCFYNLKAIFPDSEYFPPAVGKDPADMHALGVSIKEWISCGLGLDTPKSSLPIPSDYPGTPASLAKNLMEYPHLVPCPITKAKWSWKYRKDCGQCPGHIHCIKDIKV